MHYRMLLITKEYPTEKLVDETLEPFYSYVEYFSFDKYYIGGRYEGNLKIKDKDTDCIISVNSAFVNDILNFDEVDCWCYIDKDGNPYSREKYDCGNFIAVDDFEEKLKKVKADSKGCYATIIDIHD